MKYIKSFCVSNGQGLPLEELCVRGYQPRSHHQWWSFQYCKLGSLGALRGAQGRGRCWCLLFSKRMKRSSLSTAVSRVSEWLTLVTSKFPPWPQSKPITTAPFSRSPVTTAQFHSSYNSQWCYSTWTMIQVNCLPWLQRIIVCPLFPWLGSWCFWLLHLYYARAPGMIKPHSWLIWCGQGPLLTQLVQSRLIKRFWNCKTGLRKGQDRACTTTSMNFLLCL